MSSKCVRVISAWLSSGNPFCYRKARSRYRSRMTANHSEDNYKFRFKKAPGVGDLT